MIKIQKQQNISTTKQNISSVRQTASDAPAAIRAATASELTKYEKNKLAGIEDKAQQNKIEVIRLNGTRIKPDSDTKTVNISVGDLAFKSVVAPDDLSSNELFFIRCSLD